MINKLILLTFSGFMLSACSSAPTPTGAEIGPRVSFDEYVEKMGKKTKSDKRYNGFYQLYETHVTFIDSDVQSLVLQRKSDVYQWDDKKAQKEREKMFQETSSESKFMLVLFVPQKKLIDLHRGNSMWKVYLDVNGDRFESKIKKVQGHLANTSAIYPSVNRFSVPYEVSFNVPTSVIEQNDAKFILTSALGTTELNF